MEFSATSVWEITKLTVRAPGTASRLIKTQSLPLNASMLMMALAGVMSAFASALMAFLSGADPIIFQLQDGSEMVVQPASAFHQGAYAFISCVLLAVSVFYVGQRFKGEGSLADIMGVLAVLQIVMAVILVAQTLAVFVSPLISLIVVVFGLYVFFRGLGHAVNVGHEFNDMGRSILVIVLSMIAAAIGFFLIVGLLGLGPESQIR